MSLKPLKGVIRLYIGPMFSGKTSSLLEAYTRHSIGQRKCLLIKHSFDDRYNATDVATHDGRKLTSTIVCNCLYEADYLVNKYQVVCIDEVQFFEDAPIFCDKWANQGLVVEASGLCGTYTRDEFPVISRLIPLAEEVYKKMAVCRESGKDASYTFRTSNETGTVVIGGADKYKPVDRQTYFCDTQRLKSYEIASFIKCAKLYISKNSLHIDLDKLVCTFEVEYKPLQCYSEFINKFIQTSLLATEPLMIFGL